MSTPELTVLGVWQYLEHWHNKDRLNQFVPSHVANTVIEAWPETPLVRGALLWSKAFEIVRLKRDAVLFASAAGLNQKKEDGQ